MRDGSHDEVETLQPKYLVCNSFCSENYHNRKLLVLIGLEHHTFNSKLVRLNANRLNKARKKGLQFAKTEFTVGGERTLVWMEPL